MSERGREKATFLIKNYKTSLQKYKKFIFSSPARKCWKINFFIFFHTMIMFSLEAVKSVHDDEFFYFFIILMEKERRGVEFLFKNQQREKGNSSSDNKLLTFKFV